MNSPRSTTDSASGTTLVELMLVVGLVSVFMFGVCSTVFSLQKSLEEEQVVNELFFRGKQAIERIVVEASKALTTDSTFTALYPASDGTFSLLGFRLIDYFVGGLPVYDDELKVFVYGDNPTPYPCGGVIIGRGPDLATVANLGSGHDGVLGTMDDDCRASYRDGIPAVELLVPARYAPRSGKMLTIETDLAAGPLLTFTLRMNAVGQNGSFVVADDLVFIQKVALNR